MTRKRCGGRVHLESLKQRLVQRGVELIAPLRTAPFERFFFRDPVNGSVFEVIDAAAGGSGVLAEPLRPPEEEFMIVASGTGEIECGGRMTAVGPGAVMYCAGQVAHGITYTGKVPLTF